MHSPCVLEDILQDLIPTFFQRPEFQLESFKRELASWFTTRPCGPRNHGTFAYPSFPAQRPSLSPGLAQSQAARCHLNHLMARIHLMLTTQEGSAQTPSSRTILNRQGTTVTRVTLKVKRSCTAAARRDLQIQVTKIGTRRSAHHIANSTWQAALRRRTA